MQSFFSSLTGDHPNGVLYTGFVFLNRMPPLGRVNEAFLNCCQ
jgi:hypothetical protein